MCLKVSRLRYFGKDELVYKSSPRAYPIHDNSGAWQANRWCKAGNLATLAAKIQQFWAFSPDFEDNDAFPNQYTCVLRRSSSVAIFSRDPKCCPF